MGLFNSSTSAALSYASGAGSGAVTAPVKTIMATETDPNLIPAVSAQAGVRSNLSNPPDKNGTFIACCVLVIVLSTPWVFLRLYTRHMISARLWWDDWSCLLGWAFMVVLASHMIDVLRWGGGRDLWNVSQADWKLFKLHFHDTQIIARVGMCFTKISFLLFYQRIFIPAGSRRIPIWWTIWLCFWVNVLYAIALIITVSTQCIGKEAIVAAGGQCVNEYAVLICASVINVSSDLMILVIPIVCIWGLHMPAEKKRKLSAVFIIGGLAVLSSIARLGYQIVESDNPNQSLAIMIVSQLNLAEHFIGVIVSCMPILPAFFRHFRRSAAASVNGSPKGEFTANILVFQKPNVISTKRSKSSKTKDPFPVYSTTDDKMTTRGYEELDELEAQPEPRVTTFGWETQQWQGPQPSDSTHHILPVSPQLPYDPTTASVKDTENDVSYKGTSFQPEDTQQR